MARAWTTMVGSWVRLARRAAAHGGDSWGPDKLVLVNDMAVGLGWTPARFEQVACGLLDWEALERLLSLPRERLRRLTTGQLEALILLHEAAVAA